MTDTCPVCGHTYGYTTSPDPVLYATWKAAHSKPHDPRRNA